MTANEPLGYGNGVMLWCSLSAQWVTRTRLYSGSHSRLSSSGYYPLGHRSPLVVS